MTSTASTHVTSGRGSPLGAEDPDTTYLRPRGKFPFAPSLTASRPPGSASPHHPPLSQPAPRGAQVAHRAADRPEH